MHDSLIVELQYPVRYESKLKIYDTSNFWAEAYVVDLKENTTRFAIPLHDMYTASERKVDESRIRMVAFTTEMPQVISIKGFSFKQTFYDGITSLSCDDKEDVMYDITGRAVEKDRATSGIYMYKGKKILVK